ncbi:MAG: translation initiation factor IF-3 [candidate division WOR-3 bacterium]
MEEYSNNLKTDSRDRPKANEQIKVPYVRVIGADKRPIGIMPTREAIALARRQNLDLILVAPNEEPPVARIMDLGRYLYEQKARQRESKKRQHQTEVRQIRMKMKIDKHDYEVKLRKMREFLLQKDRIRLILWLRGREVLHTDLAYKLIDRIRQDLADVAKVDGQVRFQNEDRKSIQLMLVPK